MLNLLLVNTLLAATRWCHASGENLLCFQCAINLKSQEQMEWVSKCLVEGTLFVIIGPFMGRLQLTVT